MSAGKILLWIIIPYVAMAVFFVGHCGATARDQFDWTSRSTQLLDRRILGWASPMFHYGALGRCWRTRHRPMHPELGDPGGRRSPRSTYRWIAAIAGGIAGAVTLIGFIGLVYRRITQRPGQAQHDSRGFPHLPAADGADRAGLLHDLHPHPRHPRPLQLPQFDRCLVALALLPATERRSGERRAARLPATRDHRLAVLGRPFPSAASCTPGASPSSTSDAPTFSTAAATPRRADGKLAPARRPDRSHPRRDPARFRSGRDGHRDRLDRPLARRSRDDLPRAAHYRRGRLGDVGVLLPARASRDRARFRGDVRRPRRSLRSPAAPSLARD